MLLNEFADFIAREAHKMTDTFVIHNSTPSGTQEDDIDTPTKPDTSEVAEEYTTLIKLVNLLLVPSLKLYSQSNRPLHQGEGNQQQAVSRSR